MQYSMSKKYQQKSRSRQAKNSRMNFEVVDSRREQYRLSDDVWLDRFHVEPAMICTDEFAKASTAGGYLHVVFDCNSNDAVPIDKTDYDFLGEYRAAKSAVDDSIDRRTFKRFDKWLKRGVLCVQAGSDR